MPLLSFSIPQQIPLILSGEKPQTTRQPRKVPLKVGDVLYCYYKPRHAKNCDNCICYCDEDPGCVKGVGCSYWHNYFGEAKVTRIEHYWLPNYWKWDIPTNEYYFHRFGAQTESTMIKWAELDGFTSLNDAHNYFTNSVKNPQWMFMDWDVITLKGEWL